MQGRFFKLLVCLCNWSLVGLGRGIQIVNHCAMFILATPLIFFRKRYVGCDMHQWIVVGIIED
jgi:hypothetical protein